MNEQVKNTDIYLMRTRSFIRRSSPIDMMILIPSSIHSIDTFVVDLMDVLGVKEYKASCGVPVSLSQWFARHLHVFVSTTHLI
jgi:hypothetical protein